MQKPKALALPRSTVVEVAPKEEGVPTWLKRVVEFDMDSAQALREALVAGASALSREDSGAEADLLRDLCSLWEQGYNEVIGARLVLHEIGNLDDGCDFPRHLAVPAFGPPRDALAHAKERILHRHRVLMASRARKKKPQVPVYIGATGNIEKRYTHHVQKRFARHYLRFMPLYETAVMAHAVEVEKRLISWARRRPEFPCLNDRGGGAGLDAGHGTYWVYALFPSPWGG